MHVEEERKPVIFHGNAMLTQRKLKAIKREGMKAVKREGMSHLRIQKLMELF